MTNMTPHMNAKKGEIAKNVLMPGDSLRAEHIANTFLDNCRKVNDVRNIYAFTGNYKGVEVTVMASGMGIPSMGIYSYELFSFYDVDRIIRIGTCGAYTEKIKLRDVILCKGSFSRSDYAFAQNGSPDRILYPSVALTQKIEKTAQERNIPIIKGITYCSEVFYNDKEEFRELYRNYNCLAVEMEAFSLFHNAQLLEKKQLVF